MTITVCVPNSGRSGKIANMESSERESSTKLLGPVREDVSCAMTAPSISVKAPHFYKRTQRGHDEISAIDPKRRKAMSARMSLIAG
jgi:hypothetical protein